MGVLVLNLKAYKETIGDGAESIAKIAKEVSRQTGVRIIIAPQATDIAKISGTIETIAQHIDPIDPGKGTGALIADSVLKAGGIGSILNHAEKKMDVQQIGVAIAKLRELGMKSFVCASDLEEAKRLAFLGPDFLAIEPPELIGSGVSVSTAKPEIVSGAVAAITMINKRITVLCGAGISSGADAKKAKELGAKGVLLASAVTKAADKKAALLDIAKGLV